MIHVKKSVILQPKYLSIMKKVILLIAIAILLKFNASAQYKEFEFGLMGQPGFSWLDYSNENISNVKNEFTYKYGLFGSYFFAENYGFSSGIALRSNRGCYNFYYTDTGSTYSHSFSNTYMQIPLLFRGRTDYISNLVRIIGQFGASLDILIKHNDSYSTSNHYDLKYRSLAGSLIVGLGVEFKVMKSSGVLVNVVLDKGFTSLTKKDDTYYKNPITTTNLYFEFGFAF